MQMEHSEYLTLQKQLEDHFDGRYVKNTDCEKMVAREADKVDRLTVEFAKMNTKLSILVGILSAIGVPILGVCVKLLFGG